MRHQLCARSFPPLTRLLSTTLQKSARRPPAVEENSLPAIQCSRTWADAELKPSLGLGWGLAIEAAVCAKHASLFSEFSQPGCRGSRFTDEKVSLGGPRDPTKWALRC